MTGPSVSVLMPVRNAASTLDAALVSLSRQSLSDFEIVAVDDGSTDEGVAGLRAWARKDDRLRVVATGGLGLVAALERGRRLARAPLVARMDADDVAHPERLRMQVEHLNRNDQLAATGCLVRLFPRVALRSGWLRYERWVNGLVRWDQIRRERFVECPLVHPSVVVRADALENAGGYQDHGWPEDHDLWLRMLESGNRIDKVRRTLVFWRESRHRLTHTHPRYRPERFRLMKLSHLLAGPLRGRRRVSLWGAGKNGRRWARLLLDSGTAISCFFDIDPAKVGRRVYGIPVCSEERVGRSGVPFILGAVAAPGARPRIRAALVNAGRVEERDFLFVQ